VLGGRPEGGIRRQESAQQEEPLKLFDGRTDFLKVSAVKFTPATIVSFVDLVAGFWAVAGSHL